jgi:hypothetical protein
VWQLVCKLDRNLNGPIHKTGWETGAQTGWETGAQAEPEKDNGEAGDSFFTVIEKKYFKERYPFQPFGDVWEKKEYFVKERLKNSPLPANAADIPSGSYQSSCGGCRVERDGLMVVCSQCKDANHNRVESSSPVDACSGDEWLGNQNGILTCELNAEAKAAKESEDAANLVASQRNEEAEFTRKKAASDAQREASREKHATKTDADAELRRHRFLAQAKATREALAAEAAAAQARQAADDEQRQMVADAESDAADEEKRARAMAQQRRLREAARATREGAKVQQDNAAPSERMKASHLQVKPGDSTKDSGSAKPSSKPNSGSANPNPQSREEL